MRITQNKKGVVRVVIMAVLLIALPFFIFSCGGEKGGNENSSKVVVAGSTSVQPLSELLAENFSKENADIKIEVQGGGSGQGAKAAIEGIADFGALSREVDETEKEKVQAEHIIAKDGIAIIVNKETTVNNLALEQIKNIYTGKITNWKELGGEDQAISVISREEGSGTRDAFIEGTGVMEDDKDMTTRKALIQGSTGGVANTVAKTVGSIGYVSLGNLSDEVKAISVNGVEPSDETVLNGKYQLSRPFIYITAKEETAEAKKFIDYILSDEGQKIVREAGFIPVK
jgi:phosphate transport system substrate-binding protein